MDTKSTLNDITENGGSGETSNANKTMVSELCENMEGLALCGGTEDATFLIEDTQINDILVETDMNEELEVTKESKFSSTMIHTADGTIESVILQNLSNVEPDGNLEVTLTAESLKNSCDLGKHELKIELKDVTIKNNTQFKNTNSDQVSEAGRATANDTFCIDLVAEDLNSTYLKGKEKAELSNLLCFEISSSNNHQNQVNPPMLDLTLTPNMSNDIEIQDTNNGLKDQICDTTLTRLNENLNISSNTEKQGNINFNLTFDSTNAEPLSLECKKSPVGMPIQGIEAKDVLSVADDFLFAQLNESCEKKIADLKKSLPAEIQTVTRVDLNVFEKNIDSNDVPSEKNYCTANSSECLKSEDTTDLIKALLSDLLDCACKPTMNTKDSEKNQLPCTKEAEEMHQIISCGELVTDKKIEPSLNRSAETSLNTIPKQSGPTKSVDVGTNKSPLRVLSNQQATNKRSSIKLDDPFKIVGEKEENKENLIREQILPSGQYDLSIFSDSPAKPQKRNSLLRLFDPLHESVILEDPLPQLQETNENNCFFNTPLIDIDEISTNGNQKYNDVFVQIKNLLDDPDDLDTFIENLPNNITALKTKMSGAIDEKSKLEQELSSLKLEVNHLQQERAALELELRQKEEIVLEQQVQAQKKESQYKQDIKLLQEQIVSISSPENNTAIKSLQDELCLSRRREAQVVGENRKLCEKLASCMDTMSGYESMLIKVMPEHEKLQEEHNTTKQHLATLEVAFSDVHRKYERCKTVIYGYKDNEEALAESLNQSNLLAKKFEDKYQILKAHATAQMDKANKEIASVKEKQHAEVTNCRALIRKLEIKNASLQQALDQKTKECSELAALCDEMAGPAP